MNEKYQDFIESHPYEIVTKGSKQEREMRKIISEARKEGHIYIPIASKTYRNIKYCTIEQIESFVRTQIAHMKKQYFNTLRPLKNHLSDLKLQTMIEQLNLFEEENYEIKD